MTNKYATAFFHIDTKAIKSNIVEATSETDAMMRSILENTTHDSAKEYYRDWFNEIKHYEADVFKREMMDLNIFCDVKLIEPSKS